MKALFFVFLHSVPTTANLVFFILDLIGYNNLIRHSNSKNDILYKLLRLLEDREQIITERNTKTNFQITNSADQPLTNVDCNASTC